MVVEFLTDLVDALDKVPFFWEGFTATRISGDKQ